MSTKLAAVILAAGQGTRMRSERAKVLHELGGEPMVAYPLRLALGLEASPAVVVVGHRGEQVEAAMTRAFPGRVAFALQAEQKGTGHAVMMALPALEGFEGRVLILYGDVPLLTRETLMRLTAALDETGAPLSLVTTVLAAPKGYGRILRDASGGVQRIVEEKDATDSERQVTEVNAGIYCVESALLRSALARLKNDNAQGEYYLTDLVQLARADGHRVSAVIADAEEVRGANNRAELAELGAILRRRINRRHLLAGVTLVDPEHTYIGDRVEIGQDTVIEPGVHLRGATVIGRGCHLDAGCVVTDARLADGVTVKPYTVIEEADVAREAILGPFSRLRPGAEIGPEAHVGNFVELKKARLGKGSKANHLAYLGDAVIGEGANVGAGTITCNYDGFGKYLTELGDGVFIGSNSTLVAPVRVESGAYVAAGSTITEAVGKEDLAFGRAKQVNKPGRAGPLRAEAAARAKAAKKAKASE
jgi:bifunctional UDP-N-acetylglucosamine pyrophosphorylase/glucosamine-1-phosphate N-acetyltransferase